MYPVSSEGLNKETDTHVYFFTTAFHVLDNFSAHSVELWDEKFPTVEHAFQWKKYSSEKPELAEKIRLANSPDAVKKLSDVNKKFMPADWHENKVNIMEEILRAKLTQHQDVREQLLKTGNREIVENSPIDSFWGTGTDGSGENQMGKLWMKLREELK